MIRRSKNFPHPVGLVRRDQTTLTGALTTAVGQLKYVTCSLPNQGTPDFLLNITVGKSVKNLYLLHKLSCRVVSRGVARHCSFRSGLQIARGLAFRRALAPCSQLFPSFDHHQRCYLFDSLGHGVELERSMPKKYARQYDLWSFLRLNTPFTPIPSG